MRTLLCVLMLWAGLYASAHAVDTLVVPGVRVGPAVLGQSLEDLTRRIGAGKPYRSKDYTNLLYPGFTVVVSNRGQQTVSAVVVTDPPYHLKNGVAIGSSQATVLKLLGRPTMSQTMGTRTQGMIDKSLNYARLGLTVAFAKSRVVQIAIYPKK